MKEKTMGDWKEQLRTTQAERMRQAKQNMTPEQREDMRRKAAATRAKNREAKAAAGIITKPGRKPAAVNLDALAQQMGFATANEALLDMAVKKAGFASVQAAAMWAVQQKIASDPSTLDVVLPAKWDD